VVLLPETTGNRLRHVQLVPLSIGSAMLIAVTDAGTAHSAVIRIPDDMDTDELEAISRLITKRYADCTIHTVAERLVVELGELLHERRGFLTSLLRALERSTAPGGHLVELSGATNLLQYPEYRDAGRAKNFLTLTENKKELYSLLRRAEDMEFTITIGAENDADALADCSVVTARYRLGDSMTGAIGVIGPTRMPYGKVITVLEYMRAGLGEVLTHFISERE
jgi:heat-inducible transcriptional repressor